MLALFYSEASKIVKNVVPAFYKYRIGGTQLNRVYEVEEYMGDHFMAGLAKLHNHHLQILALMPDKNNQSKSLPAQVFGTRLGELAFSLKQIRAKEKGAGRFLYNGKTETFAGEL